MKQPRMENVEKARSTRHRIEIKVTEEQKELFASAAAASRLGVSEFVRSAAERAARELLAQSKR